MSKDSRNCFASKAFRWKSVSLTSGGVSFPPHAHFCKRKTFGRQRAQNPICNLLLGTLVQWSYTAGVIGLLRFVGIANIAVWFGAAIFFTLGIGPAVFSEEMRKLLGENAPYYAGSIAQILIKRYFVLQIVCATLALFHLFGEWLYLGRKPGRLAMGFLIVLFVLALAGGVWLRPKMNELFRVKYSAQSQPALKEEAARSFGVWHGLSQAANLFIIIGLGVYLVRLTRPPEIVRYSTSFTKLRS